MTPISHRRTHKQQESTKCSRFPMPTLATISQRCSVALRGVVGHVRHQSCQPRGPRLPAPPAPPRIPQCIPCRQVSETQNYHSALGSQLTQHIYTRSFTPNNQFNPLRHFNLHISIMSTRASAASVAKRRLSALSEQLVSPIPDQGTFEGIPKLKKVAGPSAGPRAAGKVVIITGTSSLSLLPPLV